MTDEKFLNWVADRLVFVYRESENVDFVQHLREIADRVGKEDKIAKAIHDSSLSVMDMYCEAYSRR